MPMAKCTVCNTEFIVANTLASEIISVKCPECGVTEDLPNLSQEEKFYTIEDIQELYDIVSNFNHQLLCEDKYTEKLVSFLECGDNKYRILG